MRMPMSRPAGLAALLIAGLALSGCMTDGYGRSYGSVSVGYGWYDDYGYPGYYPDYYGYNYGYRSEEHTSELQSLMRNSYAVFCLKKKTYNIRLQQYYTIYKYKQSHRQI